MGSALGPEIYVVIIFALVSNSDSTEVNAHFIMPRGAGLSLQG